MKKSKSSIPNDKVCALYQAVIDLIEEDVDIHSIKVVDITDRAGIGKGTAYEYFDTKEEMIVAALMNDMHQQLAELKTRVMLGSNLQEQVYGILGWIEEKFNQRRCSVQFFKMSSHSYEIRETFHTEFDRVKDNCGDFHEILKPLIEIGKKEKKIAEQMPETFVIMVLISNFISFFMYLGHLSSIKDVSVNETKDFVYRTIVKSLE